MRAQKIKHITGDSRNVVFLFPEKRILLGREISNGAVFARGLRFDEKYEVLEEWELPGHLFDAAQNFIQAYDSLGNLLRETIRSA